METLSSPGFLAVTATSKNWRKEERRRAGEKGEEGGGREGGKKGEREGGDWVGRRRGRLSLRRTDPWTDLRVPPDKHPIWLFKALDLSPSLPPSLPPFLSGTASSRVQGSMAPWTTKRETKKLGGGAFVSPPLPSLPPSLPPSCPPSRGVMAILSPAVRRETGQGSVFWHSP
jgi:hypothetical protein